MQANITVQGYTSTLNNIDIEFLGKKIPYTYSDGKIGNSRGYNWWVSKHFVATCSLGAAQKALELSRDYLGERKQFGRELAQFQALQFKLADMVTELTAARTLVRLAAFKLDEGDAEASAHCAMAKRFATDMGFEVCNQALQLHGGYGYIREYPLDASWYQQGFAASMPFESKMNDINPLIHTQNDSNFAQSTLSKVTRSGGKSTFARTYLLLQ